MVLVETEHSCLTKWKAIIVVYERSMCIKLSMQVHGYAQRLKEAQPQQESLPESREVTLIDASLPHRASRTRGDAHSKADEQGGHDPDDHVNKSSPALCEPC